MGDWGGSSGNFHTFKGTSHFLRIDQSRKNFSVQDEQEEGERISLSDASRGVEKVMWRAIYDEREGTCRHTLINPVGESITKAQVRKDSDDEVPLDSIKSFS